VLDEVLAVAAVHPYLSDAWMPGGDLVEQLGAGNGVLHARRGDQYGKQQADRVGDDVPLPPDDLLSSVSALTGGGDAFMISRRSCSGGRPKSRARPRRSKRQAARTGSINSQRAPDRSLGYGRRSLMRWTYRVQASAPRRTVMLMEALSRCGRPGMRQAQAFSCPSCHPVRPIRTDRLRSPLSTTPSCERKGVITRYQR
jgi:hypothetical protein